jgi:hypothetical protein
MHTLGDRDFLRLQSGLAGIHTDFTGTTDEVSKRKYASDVVVVGSGIGYVR